MQQYKRTNHRWAFPILLGFFTAILAFPAFSQQAKKAVKKGEPTSKSDTSSKKKKGEAKKEEATKPVMEPVAQPEVAPAPAPVEPSPRVSTPEAPAKPALATEGEGGASIKSAYFSQPDAGRQGVDLTFVYKSDAKRERTDLTSNPYSVSKLSLATTALEVKYSLLGPLNYMEKKAS